MFTYNFVDPATTHNAGIVYGITNNLDTTPSQTFSYDQLNRIISAQTTSTFATSPAHCWGETYSLDPWGNLNRIAATTNSSYTGCSQESGFSATTDGNNHLSTWAYDASGNATSDGFVTNYQWNAESQLKSAAGTSYLYDGDGRRVAKAGSTLYWDGSGGDILAETDAAGNTTAEYIFFAGKRIAMLPAGGNPLYYVEDMLGTSRVLTNNAGAVCYDADFYPYGGERTYTNSCPQNYKFEGKERDTETGNDDFGARYYSNRFGRWLSADWSAVPAPVPYANLTNPQTLNLYAMVADDPESFADLDGHDCKNAGANGLGMDRGENHGMSCDQQSSAVIAATTTQLAAQNISTQAMQAQNQSSTTATANGTTVTITTETTYAQPQGPVVGERTVENRTGTHAFRDNNPGNIRAGAFADANGAVGTDSGFAIFPSSGAGFQAMNSLLSSSSYQSLTVDQAINRYAPPSENNTATYQATIRTAVGVSGNTRMSALNPEQRGQMAQAIARHEGFYVQGTVEKVVIPIFRAP
jgi:RHS repeat-associated protein